MRQYTTVFVVLLCLGMAVSAAQGAADFDGQLDYETTSAGWYAVITGGLFTNGQTNNGTNASGGVMRYTFDGDPHPWSSKAQQTWHRDGWFADTAGVALTMKSSGSTVYDNNGIDTGTFSTNFYGNAADPSEITSGLYVGFSMANNIDWIYSGYFKLTEETSIDQISGYFAETYSYPIDLSHPFQFDMNIFSAVEGEGDNAGYLMPANTGSFRGDVFSSDNVSGTFAVSDSGQVRHYAGFSDNDDIIYQLTYDLDSSITLAAGEYFFSHSANVVPEPATLIIWAGLGALAMLVGWQRRRKVG